jgi:hypothetical protein
VTQANDFKQAQSAILENRTSCPICGNWFDRKRGEMTYTRARVFVGKVGTMAQEPTIDNFDIIKDTRKPVFDFKGYLVCVECESTHRDYFANYNVYSDFSHHSKMKDSDLIWGEA